MTISDGAVAIIVALLSGGTLRSLFLYLKDRRRGRRRAELGTEEFEANAANVTALQKQITAMTSAFDSERKAWQTRDQIRAERISELETELAEARDRLGEAQRTLLAVTRQVESLTEKLAALSQGHIEE